jgi:ribose 1,5-bisphosphokinase
MTRIDTTSESFQACREAIGPGRLVLVVGPSGAGKDTLLALARAASQGDVRIIFPRRVITRPSDGSEDHATLSPADFEKAVADGAFAVWWSAHGHQYGIPGSAEDAIRSGRTVICNVSRTVIDPLRQRYASVTVVLVTAPTAVLEHRLAGRRRSSDGDLADRVARSGILACETEPDVVIDNVGDPAVVAKQLLEIIRTDGGGPRASTVV